MEQKTFFIELVTDDVVTNQIKIRATRIKKLDYENIEADGVLITTDQTGMSFADIQDEAGISYAYDPKLSDGGGWQPLCGDAEGGEGGGSIGDDSRSRSLQRMVRRILDAVRGALKVCEISCSVTAEWRRIDGREEFRICVEANRGTAIISVGGTLDDPKFGVAGAPTWCRGQLFHGPPMKVEFTALGEAEYRGLGWTWQEMIQRLGYQIQRWRMLAHILRDNARDFARWLWA